MFLNVPEPEMTQKFYVVEYSEYRGEYPNIQLFDRCVVEVIPFALNDRTAFDRVIELNDAIGNPKDKTYRLSIAGMR